MGHPACRDEYWGSREGREECLENGTEPELPLRQPHCCGPPFTCIITILKQYNIIDHNVASCKSFSTEVKVPLLGIHGLWVLKAH